MTIRSVLLNQVTYNYNYTVMTLLAFTHLILTVGESSCNCWPITSSYGSQIANNNCLDHVIPRDYSNCIYNYNYNYTVMTLLAFTHLILTVGESSCNCWPITSSHGSQKANNNCLDHVIPRDYSNCIYNYNYTVMTLLAFTHLIMTVGESSCNCWPITSSYSSQIANNNCLDHVIPRDYSNCIYNYNYTVMTLLSFTHLILTVGESSCNCWLFTSSYGSQIANNNCLDHVIPRDYSNCIYITTTITQS